MSAADIYDFEEIIPVAVKSLFADRGLIAFTLSDISTFQRPRPRVEIIWTTHGEASPKRQAVLPDGSKRTSCYRGELRLHAITEADATGIASHSAYRAAVRDIVAGMQAALNDGILANHAINFVVAGNEETGIRPQDNLRQTTFPFTIDISIQQNAWALL